MAEKKKTEIFGMDVKSDSNSPKKAVKSSQAPKPEEKKEKKKGTTQFFGG